MKRMPIHYAPQPGTAACGQNLYGEYQRTTDDPKKVACKLCLRTQQWRKRES